MKQVFNMSDKVYDILKWIAQIALPALIVFFGVVASTCNIQNAEVILTVATAFDALLGTWLGISTVQYNKNN